MPLSVSCIMRTISESARFDLNPALLEMVPVLEDYLGAGMGFFLDKLEGLVGGIEAVAKFNVLFPHLGH